MYSYNYDNYLQHYGILGMKWGVRRSASSLSGKVDRLNRKNQKLQTQADKSVSQFVRYNAKSVQKKAKGSKYEARIAKNSAKKAKYDYKLNKQQAKRNPNYGKIAKYSAKSAKYNNKVLKAQSKIKYNKWEIKSEKAKASAMLARQKIKENTATVTVYKNTIDAINAGTIRQGRLFMKYVA